MHPASPYIDLDRDAAPSGGTTARASCEPYLGAEAAERAMRAVDVRRSEVDRLLRHVAERLRRSGVDLPDARLQHLSEELVVDVTRVVLAWTEEPLPGSARRVSARRVAARPHRRRREP